MQQIVAFLILLILSPFIAILLVLVRLESPGNPVFMQTRIGKGGKRFTIYKIRSMRLGTAPEDKVLGALRLFEQYRVTRIGRILRRYHLDELPQLFNIARGDMVFIGPRAYTEKDASKVTYAPQQLNVRPGLTGLSQLRPDRSSNRLDRFYHKKRTPAFDALILFKTIVHVATGKGS